VTAQQRLIAITGIFVFAFLGSIQALYGPLLPGLRRSFAIDAGTAGLLFTAHGLGALLGIFVPSMVRSAAIARRWLSIATALLLVGAAALAWAPTWPTTLAAAFILAMGFGVHVIRLNSLFIAGFASRGMTMTQLLNAAFSVGSILGPIAVGLAGAQSQGLFGAVAACAAVLLPLCVLTDRAAFQAPEPALGHDNKAVTSTSARMLLVAFVALMSLYVGVENSIAAWTTTFALAKGYTYAEAANLTATFFGCIFTGRLLAAWLGHRIRAAGLVIGAIVLVVICLCVAAFSSLGPVAFAVTGLALSPIFAATLVWLGSVLPTTRHANALVIGGALIGSALFPPLVGRVIAEFGIAAAAPAILCIATATLAMGVGIYVLHGTRSPGRSA
jgi:MFS transporter, FHS family, glucose/mannose:H+ symporter